MYSRKSNHKNKKSANEGLKFLIPTAHVGFVVSFPPRPFFFNVEIHSSFMTCFHSLVSLLPSFVSHGVSSSPPSLFPLPLVYPVVHSPCSRASRSLASPFFHHHHRHRRFNLRPRPPRHRNLTLFRAPSLALSHIVDSSPRSVSVRIFTPYRAVRAALIHTRFSSSFLFYFYFVVSAFLIDDDINRWLHLSNQCYTSARIKIKYSYLFPVPKTTCVHLCLLQCKKNKLLISFH